MKISFIDLYRSAFKKKDKKFRQRLSIFLVCLLISVIIWFTIKLSDNYDTVIEMPVTYINLPQNKILTFVSDTVLQVEILDQGSKLFRRIYVKESSPVLISLRFLPLYPNGNVYQGIITPSLLINEIEREQQLLGKIISVSPDTIYFSFEAVKSKKLPVEADFDLTFEKQYKQYGSVLFSPDSVIVKGPENKVADLESASLGQIKLELLSKNFDGEKTFPADSAYQNVTFIPSTIMYSIPVEKYTEAEMEIPIKISNSQGMNAKTYPDKIRVFYTVALKDYPNIEPEMINAVADLSLINLAKDDRVKISLESYPSYIRINKIEPEKVEFIIIK